MGTSPPTASPTTGISKPIVGDNTPVRTSPRSKRCRSACHPAWKSKRLSDFHLNHVFLQSDFFTTGRSSTWSHHWHRASAKHLRGNEPRLRNRPFSARHGSSRTTPGRTNSSRQSGCRERLGNTPPIGRQRRPSPTDHRFQSQCTSFIIGPATADPVGQWFLFLASTLTGMFIYALDNTIVADIIPVACPPLHLPQNCRAHFFQVIINDFSGVENLPWLSVGYCRRYPLDQYELTFPSPSTVS